MSATEEWRNVVGYEDIYEVSSQGRVRRIAGGRGAVAGRVLKPKASRKGYQRVALHGHGSRRDLSVHRLVAEAFIGAPPSPSHQVNHKDLDKANNVFGNLEWVTNYENKQHAMSNGIVPRAQGADNPNAKLTPQDVYLIRSMYEHGDVTYKELARQFSVSAAHIGSIVHRKCWACLSPSDLSSGLIERTLR